MSFWGGTSPLNFSQSTNNSTFTNNQFSRAPNPVLMHSTKPVSFEETKYEVEVAFEDTVLPSKSYLNAKDPFMILTSHKFLNQFLIIGLLVIMMIGIVDN